MLFGQTRLFKMIFFIFFFFYSGFLATVCFTDLHYGLQMWACCSQMDDDDHRVSLSHLYHSLMPTGNLPHPYRWFAFLIFLIPWGYYTQTCIIYICCAHVYQNKKKKNQVAKVCNLLPLGAQFRICRYCINIYVSVPNFTHRCVMCDEYI